MSVPEVSSWDHGDAAPSSQPSAPPRVEDLLTAIEELDARIASLSARVTGLDGAGSVWPNPPPSLRSWVSDWLIPTFGISGQLAGWESNPAVVSELSALFVGYQTMTSPEASPWDALSWHGQLPVALDRIDAHRRTRDRRVDQL